MSIELMTALEQWHSSVAGMKNLANQMKAGRRELAERELQATIALVQEPDVDRKKPDDTEGGDCD